MIWDKAEWLVSPTDGDNGRITKGHRSRANYGLDGRGRRKSKWKGVQNLAPHSDIRPQSRLTRPSQMNLRSHSFHMFLSLLDVRHFCRNRTRRIRIPRSQWLKEIWNCESIVYRFPSWWRLRDQDLAVDGKWHRMRDHATKSSLDWKTGIYKFHDIFSTLPVLVGSVQGPTNSQDGFLGSIHSQLFVGRHRKPSYVDKKVYPVVRDTTSSDTAKTWLLRFQMTNHVCQKIYSLD